MKRRDFIALFSSTAVWPFPAAAQTPPKIPRVGYIAVTTPTAAGHIVEAFRRGVRDLGYVEGKTIALEVRWAEGSHERMPGLVAELVGLNVDVLVATNSDATRAAKKVTRTIPIVMFATDPVRQG
jgi:ABC-type uncharacterized transport system substrate-binding protein